MPNKEEKNIEELFKIYENGMKLISEVSSKIDKVEKELVILEDK